MTIKERVKELCQQHGITLNQLEQELSFGKGYLSKLDNSTPNTTKIQLIAEYFDVTIDSLISTGFSAKHQLTTKDKIANLCKKRGISVYRLESETGLSHGYIGKLNLTTPSADKLQKIADYLNVSLKDLLVDSSSYKPAIDSQFSFSYEKYFQIRNSLGYKDSDVAKATNITKSTFTDWKNGRSQPKVEKIQKIISFLNIPLESLIAIKDCPNTAYINPILQRIINELEKQKLNAKDMCDYIGISSSTFSTWKSENREPKPSHIPKIADFLGVSVEYILSGNIFDTSNDIDIELYISEILQRLKRYSDGIGNIQFQGTKLTELQTDILIDDLESALNRIVKLSEI